MSRIGPDNIEELKKFEDIFRSSDLSCIKCLLCVGKNGQTPQVSSPTTLLVAGQSIKIGDLKCVTQKAIAG